MLDDASCPGGVWAWRPTMRVSGGGARVPDGGLKRNPAVHCTRLVSLSGPHFEALLVEALGWNAQYGKSQGRSAVSSAADKGKSKIDSNQRQGMSVPTP